MSFKKIFEKEILEKDALNRIKFDKTLKPEEFEVCYLDRKDNKLLTVKFSEIKIDGDFFKYKESLIPMHRIRKILWKGEVVWDRRKVC